MSTQSTSRHVPRVAEVSTQNLGETQSCGLVTVFGQCGKGLAPGISVAYTGTKVNISKKECVWFSKAVKSAT